MANQENFYRNQQLTFQPQSRYANSMDNRGSEIEGIGQEEGQKQEPPEERKRKKLVDRIGNVENELGTLNETMGSLHDMAAEVLGRIVQREPGTAEPPKSVNVVQELQQIQRNISRETDAQVVKNQTNFVLNLATKWIQDGKILDRQQGNDATVKLLQDTHLDQLVNDIRHAQQTGSGQVMRDAVSRAAEVLSRLTEQSPLREFGYFEVPKSFEDLMEYIAAVEDPKFSPGNEFALFEKTMILDRDGRPVLKPQGERGEMQPIYDVKVNKYNFIRWLMEREMYFIGQNPFAEIHIFQDVSVPSLNPLAMGYIVNNDRFWMSKTWVAEDAYVNIEDLTEEQYGELIQKKGATPFKTLDGKDQLRYLDYVEKTTPPDNNLRDEVILNMFLTETEHNMDVLYRMSMGNEKPLKEAMEKICGTNFMTRFFGIMMHDPSTSRYHNSGRDEGKKEVEDLLAQDLDLSYQGKLGKAQQRALTMYLYLTEANSAANGYGIPRNENPFDNMAVGLDDKGNRIEMADFFYKSLVKQTIERTLGDEVAGVNDLLKILNEVRTEQNPGGKRYDWEKVDLTDILFLNRGELELVLKQHKLTMEDVSRAVGKLKQQYDQDLHTIDPKTRKPKLSQEEYKRRIKQLDMVGQVNSKQQFLDYFAESRKMNFTPNDKRKKGELKLEFNKETGKWEENTKGEKLKEDGSMVNFYNSLGFAGIDYFGVKFYAQAFGGPTKDANIYSHIQEIDDARKMVQRAIADVLIHTERLDEFEARYASERSFRRTYFMGISMRNDINCIGHDAATKAGQVLYYRLRQIMGAANYPGITENLFGVKRILVDMTAGLTTKTKGEYDYRTSLYAALTGMKDNENGTVSFNINKDMGQFELKGNSMRQYFADHYSHALDLIEFFYGPEGLALIGKFMHKDAMGRDIVDEKAMKEFIDGIRKHLHYALDNSALEYNSFVAGWTKETYLKYDEEKKGFVSDARIIFGVRKLKDLMFNDEVQEMGMYERPDRGGIKAGKESVQMARNVLAYLVAKEIQSHGMKGNRSYWPAGAIEQIAEALRRYGVGVLEMANDEAIFLRGFFTPQELRTILGTAEIFLLALYSREYSEDIFGGFLQGLALMFSQVVGEIGAGITLKA